MSELKQKLLDQGMLALGNCNPDLAAKFFAKALELDKDDTDTMDALADALVQCGRGDEARPLLETSARLQPDRNPAKWFYLAQLQHSEEALRSLTSGVEALLRVGDLSDPAVRAQLGKAFASVAELFLTDLCFAPDAERRCEEAVEQSLRHHSEGMDGRLALVSLRLSQSRTPEAAQTVEQVFLDVMAVRQRLAQRSIVQEMQSSMEEVEAVESDVCLALAKLLLECAASRPDLLSAAAELLEDLLLDDDEQPEVHYLLGVALAGEFPEDPIPAAEHFEAARALLERQPNEEDTELLAAVREHLKDIAEGRPVQFSGCRLSEPGERHSMDDEEWSEEEDEET